jgi:site-specific DNA-adenine methylase
LRELRRFLPPAIRACHEPSLGSGALFFDLWKSGNLRGIACHLGDVTADLIGVYQAVAQDTDSVIAELRKLSASTHAMARLLTTRFVIFISIRSVAPEAPGGELYSPAGWPRGAVL